MIDKSGKMNRFAKFTIIALLSTLSLVTYSQTGAIRINQLGYYPDANKIAIVANSRASNFEVVNTEDNSIEFTGILSPPVYWPDAGDSVQQCNFSELTKAGSYKIVISGFGESYPFEISETVFRKAAYASLKSYYYQRCSYELTEPYAGLWARAAGHPDTACILHSSTGKTGKISSPGGWYDAGDYGKYVINAGISVATMLSFYENFSNFFADGSIHIPESGNGKNDLLDEVKFELDWLKTMQDDDGGVFFKLTTLNFQGFIMPSAAMATRYVIGKTTASALDFAAMMAMAGRIYQDYDADYAIDCILRAESAWSWAKANPTIYFKNPSDVSTGEYGDGNVSDEFLWAAAELFITTGKEEYKSYLESRSNSLKYLSAPGWPAVQPLASLSLATRPNGLPESLLNTIKSSILSTSDNWLNQIIASPCRIPKFNYGWGSNSGLANMGVGLLYAWILSKDEKYIKGAAECADYLLGKNATGYSFVSSYGYKTPVNFHHRPSGADGIVQPVPGFIAGGPNKDQQDKQRYPFSQPAKSYVDVVGSYASNEVCINWNSPLTALLAGVDAALGDSSEVAFEVQTVSNNPPVISLSSPTYDYKAGSDQPLLVKGTATDPDGIAKVELYLDARYIDQGTSGQFEWALENISFGSHTITILAYDTYGLTSEITHRFSYVPVSIVPGKVEAENYSNMSGVAVQATTDEGGGSNITSFKPGDWIEYTVNVREPGNYRAEFRIASTGGGKIELRKPTQFVLCSTDFEATGGSQSWTTVADTVTLSAGKQTVRAYAMEGVLNMNWINFLKVDVSSIPNFPALKKGYSLQIFPNPVRNIFSIAYKIPEPSNLKFVLYDITGRLIEKRIVESAQVPEGILEWQINSQLPSGNYYITMYQDDNMVAACRFSKSL